MIYESVPHIFETIDKTRHRLMSRVEALNSEQLTRQPRAESWSVAEIIEHLAKIEARLLGLLKMMLKKAEAADPQPAAQASGFKPFSLDEYIERARKEKYTAPESVQPAGVEQVTDSLSKLRASRAELHSLSPRIETLDLSHVTYPHPAFGPLNFYQWLAFIGMHEERHLRQIESVLRP